MKRKKRKWKKKINGETERGEIKKNYYYFWKLGNERSI